MCSQVTECRNTRPWRVTLWQWHQPWGKREKHQADWDGLGKVTIYIKFLKLLVQDSILLQSIFAELAASATPSFVSPCCSAQMDILGPNFETQANLGVKRQHHEHGLQLTGVHLLATRKSFP